MLPHCSPRPRRCCVDAISRGDGLEGSRASSEWRPHDYELRITEGRRPGAEKSIGTPSREEEEQRQRRNMHFRRGSMDMCLLRCPATGMAGVTGDGCHVNEARLPGASSRGRHGLSGDGDADGQDGSACETTARQNRRATRGGDRSTALRSGHLRWGSQDDVPDVGHFLMPVGGC